jgi:hypothetical protein
MKRSITITLVLLVSIFFIFTGCDAIEDALDSAGPGVKGKVTDRDDKALSGAKVTVIGFTSVDDLNALAKSAGLSSVDELLAASTSQTIDIEKLAAEASTKKTETTGSDGKYSVSMTSPLYFVFVEGPDDTYKTAFSGIPLDKKIKTMTQDFYDYISSGLKDEKKEDYMLVMGTSKEEADFKILGGSSPAPAAPAANQVTPAPAQTAAPAPAPADSPFVDDNTTPVSTPEAVATKTPPAGSNTNKDYYSFSFVFSGDMDGSAYGVFDRSSFGQPIPVTTNLEYKRTSGNWAAVTAGAPVKRGKEKGSAADTSVPVTGNTVILTGFIDAFKGTSKYLVYEVKAPGKTEFSRHYHFIGFDPEGLYETRAIVLAEGWVTRLSMCEDVNADNTPKNQSFTVTFDDSANSKVAKVVSLMSYNKGFAQEQGKNTEYSQVIDMDFAMTDITGGRTVAWYNSNNNSGKLSFDTWFGYGPEMVIGYIDKEATAWSGGFTPFAEPYSIGSYWSGQEIEIRISIITATGSKDFKDTFTSESDSFSPGSYDLSLNSL